VDGRVLSDACALSSGLTTA
jgi:hypothetical protein